jgi:3',5'-nucleoside bisphosphate phosphatase
LSVDLHTHTTASDGSLSARALVELARSKGLEALAISDHDSTDSLDDALAAGRQLGVEVIPGIEMSTDVAESEIHVLGYFMDYHDAQFQTLLGVLREARLGRARKMVEKLQAMGMPLDWQRVQSYAGVGAVGRPHVAKAMVEAGYVPDIKTAFDRYISRNGPAYVERYKLTPVEAVQLLLRVGGMPVLAHPLEGIGSVPMIPELAAGGLGGIECYYTGYTTQQVSLLETIAHKYGLATSGGSDFHGEGVAANSVLGQPIVPYSVLANLRAAWEKRRSAT